MDSPPVLPAQLNQFNEATDCFSGELTARTGERMVSKPNDLPSLSAGDRRRLSNEAAHRYSTNTVPDWAIFFGLSLNFLNLLQTATR